MTNSENELLLLAIEKAIKSYENKSRGRLYSKKQILKLNKLAEKIELKLKKH